MLATNIEQEVKAVLEKKGKGGWLRVGKCSKIYGNGNDSKETSFYRWRKKVENGKIENFQVLKLPGNISFIGLKGADPKALEALISEDKKISQIEIGPEMANALFYYRLLEKEYGVKGAGGIADILEDLCTKFTIKK
jgi:hypothetical protein